MDHVLVCKALWGAVVGCGVHIPSVRWDTDHRMVELDLGRCDEGLNNAFVVTEAHQREEKSEEAKERAAIIKDMNNDKAAGLDGYGIEMENSALRG